MISKTHLNALFRALLLATSLTVSVALPTGATEKEPSAPSPTEACAAYIEAVRNNGMTVEGLAGQPEWATHAVSGCRDGQSDVQGQAALGLAMVASGDANGVPLVREAALAGDPEALYAFGRWTAEGLILDGRALVAMQPTQSLDYLQRAADLGHAHAQLMLANQYFLGQQVTQNLVRARNLYRKAATRDVPEALTALGMMHVRGQAELPRDRQRGNALIARAAAQGHELARWMLADWTTAGSEHTGLTINQAIETLEDLSKAGYFRAIVSLGSAYWYGTVVPQDQDYAADIFCRGGPRGRRAYEIYADGALRCDQ